MTTQREGLSLKDFFEISFLISSKRFRETIITEGNLSDFPELSIELDNISDAYAEQNIVILKLFLQTL